MDFKKNEPKEFVIVFIFSYLVVLFYYNFIHLRIFKRSNGEKQSKGEKVDEKDIEEILLGENAHHSVCDDDDFVKVYRLKVKVRE